MDIQKSVDNAVLNYDRATWVRALAQLAPGGGVVDVLLTGRAAILKQAGKS